MNTVELEVTKKHFDLAAKAYGWTTAMEACLLAQAFRAAFPKKYVSVGYHSATVGRGKSERTFDLPIKATRLIQRFDELLLPMPGFMLTKADKNRIAKFRGTLPVTIKVEERPTVSVPEE
jgi:hypothetical protein